MQIFAATWKQNCGGIPSFADRIGVTVEKGVVTLIGDVDHVGARWDAEETTKRVRGVKAVANEIKIKILPKVPAGGRSGGTAAQGGGRRRQ